MKKQIIWLSAIALSTSFAPTVFANQHMKNHENCPCMNMQQGMGQGMGPAMGKAGKGGMGMGMKEMMGSLNLTPAQQEQIKAIRAQAVPAMQTTRQEMQTIRAQMHDLIKSEQIDEAKLTALMNKKSEMMTSMMKANVMTKNKIYNLLDANQKAKFDAAMKKYED